jgi:hypothetical protein
MRDKRSSGSGDKTANSCNFGAKSKPEANFIKLFSLERRSQYPSLRDDIAVGTTNGYGLDNQVIGVQVSVDARFSSSPLYPGSKSHPASYPESLYQRVKQPEREAVHSPPSSAEINNTWIYISTPPYAFMTSA